MALMEPQSFTALRKTIIRFTIRKWLSLSVLPVLPLKSFPALTGFWIESSLKISPREQTEVMERIFGEASVYSAESRGRLKQVMFVPELSDSQISIYGKTGMGKAHGVTVDAWFTGFADVYGERRYFCVYLGETEGREVTSTRAKEIAGEILKAMEKPIENQ